MTSRLSLLFASTALAAALGLPALAAMQTQGSAQNACSGVCEAVFNADGQPVPLIRVSGDDDDDDDGGWFRRGHEDDDDDEDCDDDDDDDDDDCAGTLGNPAPAGTVAPPANGLFGNGAPPVAVTN
ncbi:hypothetical protein CN97_04015 [Haematobacter massiliensis]|jgi:hypothetical protein|uniref:Uncharacterized protein n=1 Tax=Haematobacter massiliensis TaxID=195105 RepID=A0A086XVK8_9RHOB|nr:hypothetical protein [Haematobacter massiliensis]KFI26058.1 hypothetical protein CN97_04015 [Haematobacter massiliensis]OWJ86282.1 hypothetical protein CDV51_10670 [Haematobacter massiliensis]